MKKYIGIDIGGTNIKYGLIDDFGQILDSGKVATKDNRKEILSTISVIVEKYRRKNCIEFVGISVPGVVNEFGYLVTGGAIHSLYDFDFEQKVEERIGLPAFVENDANCALLAEKWLGAAQGVKDCLGIVVGTGIGGAMLINNQIYRGFQNKAGEFGFMLVDQIIDGNSRDATLSLKGSIHDGVTTPYNQTMNENFREALPIFAKYPEDQVAKEIIDNFYQALAIGIFNLAFSLDPQKILIGGAISSDNHFIQRLNAEVEQIKNGHGDMANLVTPPIVACDLKNDAGIIGAVYCGLSHLKKNQAQNFQKEGFSIG
ncbi:ROK family protein [Enterococcus sp. LJL90]